jgi:DNA sulfur modification protein DndC
MGPLTMDARRFGLDEVLRIQDDINAEAVIQGRPQISLINEDEHARILALIEANTWPQKWTGSEPRADEPFEDGGQQLLPIYEEA